MIMQHHFMLKSRIYKCSPSFLKILYVEVEFYKLVYRINIDEVSKHNEMDIGTEIKSSHSMKRH